MNPTEPASLEPFREALMALQRLLRRYDDRGAVIGGIAASLLGAPRFTDDIDAVFLLSLQDVPAFLDAARAEGLASRIEDAPAFARRTRVLLLRHEASGTPVDISLGVLPFELEMVERARTQAFGNLALRLPTPEDLIITKAIASRPKDLEDIRAIAARHPVLDRGRIEAWVTAFAEVLETPDLWQQVKALL